MAAAKNPKAAARLKGIVILSVVVLSGLVFLAWSQPWGSLSVTSTAGAPVTVSIDGSVAAPALSALGLAGLALAAALAIAGRFIRVILGALEAVLGVSIVLSGIGPIVDPVAAGAPTVTLSTGVAGTASVRAIATDAGLTAWPFVAVALGVLIVVTGVLIAISTTRWPDAGRKYQAAVRFEAADGRSSDNPAELFDDDDENGDDGGDDENGDAPGKGTGDDDDTGDDTEAAPGPDGKPGGAAQAPDAATARAIAVDNWDSLSQGRDPTA